MNSETQPGRILLYFQLQSRQSMLIIGKCREVVDIPDVGPEPAIIHYEMIQTVQIPVRPCLACHVADGQTADTLTWRKQVVAFKIVELPGDIRSDEENPADKFEQTGISDFRFQQVKKNNAIDGLKILFNVAFKHILIVMGVLPEKRKALVCSHSVAVSTGISDHRLFKVRRHHIAYGMVYDPVYKRRGHDGAGLFLVHGKNAVPARLISAGTDCQRKRRQRVFPMHGEPRHVRAFLLAPGSLAPCLVQIFERGDRFKRRKRERRAI